MCRRKQLLGCALLLACLAAPAQAGRSCEEKQPSPDSFRLALGTAQQTQQRLEQLGTAVAIIGRVGQDLSKYGLRYTHAGIVYRAGDGRWRVAELLNECGSDRAELWNDGLGTFFLDDMFAFDTVLLLPPPAVARSLGERLQDGPLLRTMFSARYSLTAYPFATRYQNSNAWVLETLAAASSGNRLYTREQSQQWLQKNGYQPSELNLGALTRLGGRMFKANVAFDDHPNELRYSDRIRTVTVDSIIQFFMARNEGWQVEELAAPVLKRY